MKVKDIAETIKALQKIKREHGNLPVLTDEYWAVDLQVEFDPDGKQCVCVNETGLFLDE